MRTELYVSKEKDNRGRLLIYMLASQFSASMKRNAGISNQGTDCQSTEGEETGGSHDGVPALESVSLPHRVSASPPPPRTLGIL